MSFPSGFNISMVNQLVLPSSTVFRPRKDVCTPLTISANEADEFEDVALTNQSALRDKGNVGYETPNLLISIPQTPEQQLLALLQLDPVAFWSQVKFSNMRDTLEDTMIKKIRHSFQNPADPSNAVHLSRMVIALNLQNDVIAGLTSEQRQNLSAQTGSSNLLQICPSAIAPSLKSDHLGTNIHNNNYKRKRKQDEDDEEEEFRLKSNNYEKIDDAGEKTSKNQESILMQLLQEPPTPKRKRIHEDDLGSLCYSFDGREVRRRNISGENASDSFTMLSL